METREAILKYSCGMMIIWMQDVYKRQEIHFLERPFRETFLNEMSLVAEAVYNAFGPDKLNYELLGQGENVHMHWHIFPRRKGDTPEPGPVWKLPREEMYACLLYTSRCV